MERTQKELYWYWMASCPGVGIGSIFDRYLTQYPVLR